VFDGLINILQRCTSTGARYWIFPSLLRWVWEYVALRSCSYCTL